MTDKEFITDALTLLGAMSVAISAWFWWKSSEIDVDPPAMIHPDIPFSADGDYSGTVVALKEIGRLNKLAATWSAISAIYFCLAAVL